MRPVGGPKGCMAMIALALILSLVLTIGFSLFAR